MVDDEDLGQKILEMEVRGKHGVGSCKSMPGAVSPFERLRSRVLRARKTRSRYVGDCDPITPGDQEPRGWFVGSSGKLLTASS